MAIVILHNKSANEIIDIVRGMRGTGLIQGIDFDFKFMPLECDPESGNLIKDKHTVFNFYDEKWATFFMLKWQ